MKLKDLRPDVDLAITKRKLAENSNGSLKQLANVLTLRDEVLKLPSLLQEAEGSGASESNLIAALEHATYNDIPGTNQSYRQDKGRETTRTKDHAHVYAKRGGEGKELYSVNIDGTGHDGSRGATIPKRHAEFFRSIGYRIPDTLTLESLMVGDFEKREVPIDDDHGLILIILIEKAE